jgi:hypothetical protein
MYRETEILKQPGVGEPDVFGDMVINIGHSILLRMVCCIW